MILMKPAQSESALFFSLPKSGAAANTKDTEREVSTMTEKELLYVEDALGHEQHFRTECQNAASRLQDAELKSLSQQLEQKHRQIFQSFYDLL